MATGMTCGGLSRGRSGRRTFFLGTYTRGESEGIYRCLFDDQTGALEIAGATSGIESPSFLAIDKSGANLYAVSESSGGEVFAYRIDAGTNNLELLNRKPSRGGGPCYITTDRAGRNVLVANYGGGSVTVLPIGEEGRLEDPSDVEQHEGSGADPGRQDAPHAHCIVLDAGGRYAFAVDLGIDRVMVYRFDSEAGTLELHQRAEVPAGAGPRHLAFRPDGRYAYVINELDSTITTFAYDAAEGRLQSVQTISTLPDGYDGESYCADVHAAPSGRFLYGSNRGHNSITVFAVDDASGMLTPIQYASTGGDWPRNFAIDPTGGFLLAANQRSDDIVVFAVDAESGRLEPTGHVLEVPSPVCIRFYPE